MINEEIMKGIKNIEALLLLITGRDLKVKYPCAKERAIEHCKGCPYPMRIVKGNSKEGWCISHPLTIFWYSFNLDRKEYFPVIELFMGDYNDK